ncbi:MAG: CoA pyrophosphatase [Nitrososphaerota archaeon]|nr:CoA pyrophosphatase [Aigarchaeota archaeon]MDW8077048.1 CoA pyrophosphatase [Nitrososphaerota archaeon]
MPTRIAELLAKRLRPVGELLPHSSSAAVMLMLFLNNSDLEVLFVKRKDDPNDPWSGQVALPGGRRKPSDNSILETAVRETFEEVGIMVDPRRTVLGALPDVSSLRNPDILVTPFVALLEEKRPVKLSSELSDYFWASIKDLRKDEVKVSLQNGETKTVKAYVYGVYVIWGLTAQIIDSLLKILED